ncbi:MAG: hypothetical protein D4R77_09740 [Planctomycetaceae bacterium]|nr:MAG: hypothetical protein D4R77_09740 [Planctomycetaceae bacterium]
MRSQNKGFRNCSEDSLWSTHVQLREGISDTENDSSDIRTADARHRRGSAVVVPGIQSVLRSA